VLLLVAALAAHSSTAAAAEEKDACVDAHALAQKHLRAGRFQEARDELATCTREVCPAPVRVDCASYASALAAAQPTVLFEVRDESGAPTFDVTVGIDALPPAPLGTVAIPVDPGPHTVTVKRPNGASRTIELAAREGQSSRVVIDFAPPPATNMRDERPWPRVSQGLFVLGGTALATSAVFGILAFTTGNRLERQCGATRSCEPVEVEWMTRQAAIADVSLVVAAVSTVLATVFLVTHRAEPRR
jgi:hypothetical protein